MTAAEPLFCGLRVTTSLPSSTRSSPFPRDARLVHSTVPGPWIGNVLTTYSRDNHTASLSEMSLFTCSRVRIPTTTSCAPESDSPADYIVIETSEPPQGAKVLTDDQSRLTPTDANGWFNLEPVSSRRPYSRAQSAKERPFSPTHSYGLQRRQCQASPTVPYIWAVGG